MILIELNRRDFEYDVHSLVQAFFPGKTVSVARHEEEIELKVSVFFADREVSAKILSAEGQVQESAVRSFSGPSERMEQKNAVKKALYTILCSYTGRTLPWGDLTGIRPVKLAMKLVNEGAGDEDIVRWMQDTYFVSEKKALLSAQVARREKRLLGKLHMNDGYSLYVGIPFCPSICLYCSFGSSPIGIWKDRTDDYLDALFREIRASAPLFAGKKLDTIYIGGGTPTTLSDVQLDRLLGLLEETFDYTYLQEFTVEAGRPDCIDRARLSVLRDHGISRICINPQTMNQKTLDLIGRAHTVEETEAAFSLAREMGFDNINMDLIVGLPGEGADEVRYTMERLRKLGPDSITVHSLALKRATRLHLMEDVYRQISFNNSQETMDMTQEICASGGLFPYYLYRQKNMAGNFENVGYAREGKECLYNILIMEEVQSILAVGAGASTKMVYDDGRIERVENVKDIRSYIERIEEMIERKRGNIHG